MNITVNGLCIDVIRAENIVVGSGCAGLNAADWLHMLGKKDTILITDGINRGTSRNAGSDKQTYYKMSVSGSTPDCVSDMARDFISEGVNGDTALAEAAGSLQAFYRLVQLGVEFPTNEFGEFVGYQTDHDTRSRATSAGPLTSKQMTECLERQVREKNIPILDRTSVFSLLCHENRIAGVLAYDQLAKKILLALAANVIIATGGPAQIYDASVFPESQMGMSGMAISAGARMANLHQWQYGLASVKFRWNVSGSYQQVLPKFVSVDQHGNTREFLNDYFTDTAQALEYTFLKGYQWPFDVRKAQASSLIDLLVHRENSLGRRVYMDFRQNPSVLKADFSNLAPVAREYLEKTGCTQDTPFKRLMHMNPQAVDLYRSHDIDLEREMLEVRVCAQHHNGGIAVNAAWQSSISGLYAVGEAAGTFGAYRPGGSALNAAQVGSMRAAQSIAYDGKKAAFVDANALIPQIKDALDGLCFTKDADIIAKDMRSKMSFCGAHLRLLPELRQLHEEIDTLLTDAKGTFTRIDADFEQRIRLRDQLVTQKSVISAMLYAAQVYGSTGAGLVADDEGEIDIPQLGLHTRAHLERDENLVIYTENNKSFAEAARPMPQGEQWFENAWRAWRKRVKNA